MSRYAYTAIDPSGHRHDGAIEAAGDDAARTSLEARRWFVVSLSPAPAAALAGAAPAAGLRAANDVTADGARVRPLRPRELAMFTRQLSTLVAVAPLAEALRTIARQSEAAHVRAVVGAIERQLIEGRRLSDAMARQPRSFPPLYAAMVAAGEGSGTLPDILDRLAVLLERQAEVRGKVMAALAYPIVLAVVAVAVVAGLMLFVVPRVVEQFDDVGQQLPFLTRAVIAVSDGARDWGWLAALLMAGGAAVTAILLRDPARRLAFDGWLLRLPLIGRLIRDLNAARFARTLATMVGARLPLVDGLRATLPTIGNRAIRAATAKLIEEVRGGGGLSGAMRTSGLFPPLLVYMTASGESAGALDALLARAADYLDRDFDRFTATALALLEPVIIIVMGVVVALIVLAILLPILQLQQLTGA